VGEEVARLPRRAGVAGREGRDGFGAWFARERRLRGVPLDWVATSTKIPLPRLEGLERGEPVLASDGAGRAAARALARAIGADPEEAAGRIHDGAAPPAGRAPREWRLRVPRWVPGAVACCAAAGLAWALAVWIEGRPPPSPEIVPRPDYVERLRTP
jgi:hypothetical protein